MNDEDNKWHQEAQQRIYTAFAFMLREIEML